MAKNAPCAAPKVVNPRTGKCVQAGSRALRFSGYYNGGFPLHELFKNVPGTRTCGPGKTLNPTTDRCITVGGVTWLKLGYGSATKTIKVPNTAEVSRLTNALDASQAEFIKKHDAHRAALTNLQRAERELALARAEGAMRSTELEAAHARIDALENELADKAADVVTAAARIGALEKELSAKAAAAQTKLRAAETRVRDLEKNVQARNATIKSQTDSLTNSKFRGFRAAVSKSKGQNIAWWNVLGYDPHLHGTVSPALIETLEAAALRDAKIYYTKKFQVGGSPERGVEFVDVKTAIKSAAAEARTGAAPEGYDWQYADARATKAAQNAARAVQNADARATKAAQNAARAVQNADARATKAAQNAARAEQNASDAQRAFDAKLQTVQRLAEAELKRRVETAQKELAEAMHAQTARDRGTIETLQRNLRNARAALASTAAATPPSENASRNRRKRKTEDPKLPAALAPTLKKSRVEQENVEMPEAPPIRRSERLGAKKDTSQK